MKYPHSQELAVFADERKTQDMVFRFGELFCGAGGMGLGAKQTSVTSGGVSARIAHAWATDYDPDACETYRRNICPNEPHTVVCQDIRELDFAALCPIDALAFGFPCNDYSVVGEQKGINGVYGPLYTYGVKALVYFRPMWFIAENVGGLRNANDGKALEIVLESLEASGYRLVSHLYRFEDYGVPQTRHRLVIVGVRSDLDIQYRVPAPLTGTPRTCRDAIENPPIAPDAANHEYTRQSGTVVARLRHIRPGENAFTAKLPSALQLNVKGARISQIYRRLDPEKPSYTVTGSGGGGTHVYHWEEPRALTNRERARLQTFPDDFVFCGGKESVRRQIGMAVPPEAAEIVLSAVLKSFAQIEYDRVEPSIPRTDDIRQLDLPPFVEEAESDHRESV